MPVRERKYILIPDHTFAIQNVEYFIKDFSETYQYNYYVYSLELLKKSISKKRIYEKSIENIVKNHEIDLFLVPVSVPINDDLHELFLNKITNYATPSTGTDHVDYDFIKKNGILFFDAAGENALSVVEYTLSILPYLVEEEKILSKELQIGIVGFGRIGSLLGKVLKDLEIPFKVYDPFVFPANPQKDFQNLFDCNVISFHVPLTYECVYPTLEMVNKNFLRLLRKNVVIINTSRGKIFSMDGYYTAVQNYICAMDVYYNEPPGKNLLKFPNLRIATPHIAGYHWEARFRGVLKVFEKFIIKKGENFPFTLSKYKPKYFSKEIFSSVIEETLNLKNDPLYFRIRDNYPSRASIRDQSYNSQWKKFHKLLYDYFFNF